MGEKRVVASQGISVSATVPTKEHRKSGGAYPLAGTRRFGE
jgi:hypothetical protein